MKFIAIAIAKERVLSELTIGNKVFMIDKYNECIEDVEDIDIVRLACAIKGEGEETQYEFYKKVIME